MGAGEYCNHWHLSVGFGSNLAGSLFFIYPCFFHPPFSVSRLVEEVKLRHSSCQLQNEDVYMNTTFQDFIQRCVRKIRGEDNEEELIVDYVSQFGCEYDWVHL